ncbi:DUF2147 domain-containing protein [Bradyrhizobium sp. BR 10289]|uniref:DUF2147 domain-containing protein n=1 Tax=Bradyrhizobium sp. BR 10289 TaxID=2749993 RepID=UPI001C64A05B|nr:DUF2147 domain-containing protein [Bradyrhizobium sp. BR 10289]MBW7970338.1 DUF2147 domain-containing protein [Bradyrhizobium sp. BR 10289]
MTRLVTSLGIVIALTVTATTAQAGSYSFSIGGHRFRIEAPRNCRSTSCVSISERSLRTTDDVATAPLPAPAPVVQAPPPVYAVAPVRPVQATVVAPPPVPPAPVLAATTSQPVVPPPAPKVDVPSPNPPRVELSRLEPPKTIAMTPDPPQAEPPPADLRFMPARTGAKTSDDEPAYLPLGQWESDGAKGVVRIERCGPALCGYVLTETSSRGESVLVNMKPKAHDAWAGSIYSRSSGNTYYGTMTLKSSGKLYVEACALGRFWCSGNDWTRVEERREPVITTSRQWGARS